MKLIAPITALLVAILVSPVSAQESSRKDFQDFCKAFEGRWVGSVTWVADWPGFGKRGDKVTAYSECKLAEDGNALIVRFYAGEGSGTWLVVFDAGAKQIKSLWVNSGGGVTHSVIHRKGKNWVEKGSGSEADGANTEFTSTITITDKGNTHTWTGSGTVGGKKNDAQHDVWRRVSK